MPKLTRDDPWHVSRRLNDVDEDGNRKVFRIGDNYPRPMPSLFPVPEVAVKTQDLKGLDKGTYRANELRHPSRDGRRGNEVLHAGSCFWT